MTPASSLLMVVSLGISVACALRKSVVIKRHHPRSAAGRHGMRSSDQPPTWDNNLHIQATGNESSTKPAPVISGTEAINAQLDGGQPMDTKISLVFLGDAPKVTRTAIVKVLAVNYLATVLSIVLVMCFCCFLSSTTKEYDTETDINFAESETESDADELITRLSQCLQIRIFRGSSCGTEARERQIGMWWRGKSHSWATTRLGWWESKRQYLKQSPALDGFLLRDIFDVRLTDGVDDEGKPGLCISHEGQGPAGAGHVLLFFPTAESAAQYAKDLRLMVRKVNRVSAARSIAWL